MNNRKQIGSTLTLTAFLSLAGGLTLINSTTALANKINPQVITVKANKIQPVPIPKDQLPSPLDAGVVFREISSGGFAGAVYETVLLNDGLLNRVRIGDANDSERSVRRVPVEQVKQFKKLLNKKNFEKYNNLSYPAPSGAADFITYTLSSQSATTQYNDISQGGLPNQLSAVVKAWNELKNSARPL
ncbi:hypothetical protein B6N60_02387 [Richelia sinica FACHB-800]|uniref:Uncharacterized protein n=1 Tax=Richelia sinica FACHB-800 TaxID=1357546 RepID=A0A975Y4Z8_9NOST|nr:hypothetical protein [Richelia sinica]MBD2665238.1 hypothetical protein [Richelia sinica FACHB-800]QXE23697.1 hypothetical protein B6N60_02387 [Richelia sinica FACHB-800]